MFIYNEKNRKINSDIVIILSQDISQNQLGMVDEEPLDMEEDKDGGNMPFGKTKPGQ